MKSIIIIAFAFINFISCVSVNKSLSHNEKFIDSILNKLQENYLHEGLITENKAKLRQELLKVSNNDKKLFAINLTNVLQRFINDKHLEVREENPSSYNSLTQEELLIQLEKDRYKIGKIYVKDNIGYLEMDGFADPSLLPDLFKKYISKTFLKLNPAKALIIDLRNSGGGSPAMVATICSFVLEANYVCYSFWFITIMPY